MGIFNKSNSGGGLSRKERKERDEIIRKAVEEKRRNRADSDEIDAEDWNRAEDGWRPDNW